MLAPGSSPLSLCAPLEVLSEEDKLKMSKIKKKMRRKVRAWGSGTAQLWVGAFLVQGVPEWVLSSPQAKNKQKQEAKAPRAKEAKKKSKVSLWTRVGQGEGGDEK